jgi:hypothetical protein
MLFAAARRPRMLRQEDHETIQVHKLSPLKVP